ncbi:hypothetical protein RO3G_01639 [Rhizopus delemar RA 99-880]|uniref:Uncharacterized protein n=1 Tax=Rhizopus delemar (strain RA 99-880 / ATCC MYA-4621 / FGSC 9543 / NRRL 43880) TaxID=246409 RepID=I1BL55_RHIO9|nr:hypothetical protein RO3G_01639 [Rhizopus delemar RA 99-880]|eukprot:EIE76935.1 hypothetical protein RO3G_01639 [Rhizopus delemar RA 99-880]
MRLNRKIKRPKLSFVFNVCDNNITYSWKTNMKIQTMDYTYAYEQHQERA